MQSQLLDDDLIDIQSNKPVSYAGFWIRVVAAILDGLIFVVFILIVSFFSMGGLSVYSNLFIYVLLIFYKPYFEFRYGATLGKMALGLKVVNHQLAPIDMKQAILRFTPWLINYLLSILSTILALSALHTMEYGVLGYPDFGFNNFMEALNTLSSLFVLVSGIVIAFDSKKQGLHDMIGNTLVIYK